jgi:hypothetical protein
LLGQTQGDTSSSIPDRANGPDQLCPLQNPASASPVLRGLRTLLQCAGQFPPCGTSGQLCRARRSAHRAPLRVNLRVVTHDPPERASFGGRTVVDPAPEARVEFEATQITSGARIDLRCACWLYERSRHAAVHAGRGGSIAR